MGVPSRVWGQSKKASWRRGLLNWTLKERDFKSGGRVLGRQQGFWRTLDGEFAEGGCGLARRGSWAILVGRWCEEGLVGHRLES